MWSCISQGYKRLLTFDTVSLRVFSSFRAERNAARKLVTLLFTEKGSSSSLKNLCLAHGGFCLVRQNGAVGKSYPWTELPALPVQ